MKSIFTDLLRTQNYRRGFTLIELVMVIVAMPVLLFAVILLNAYVPTIILRSFDYDVDLWEYLSVGLTASMISFTVFGLIKRVLKKGPALAEESLSSKKSTKHGTSFLKYVLGHSLNSLLIMLILGSFYNNNIGYFYIFLAGLPIPTFYKIASLSVSKFRKAVNRPN